MADVVVAPATGGLEVVADVVVAPATGGLEVVVDMAMTRKHQELLLQEVTT